MAAAVDITTITAEGEAAEGDEAATAAEATVASFPTGFRDIIQ